MAVSINVDVYEFSTGNQFAAKYTRNFIVANIMSVDSASIYDFQNRYFTGVRSKITENWGGVPKDRYVDQTVAQIQAAIIA